MTTIDMDRASVELANAAAAIMERHGLTASALLYVLKGLEAQVSEARLSEILAATEPKEEKPLREERKEEIKTVPRNHASLNDIQEIIQEKIACGDVDENGHAHCSLREAMERTAANDSSNN